ncbi:ABC transporter substrate-binding protein [Paenibacillus yanchengensis]|uniref:ABC transporter substrate-binding protein n=1 Tax=Paenibacillus yanchengensis TaxID=2035833 RepID=A0ABW4YIY1_9BACL
MIIISWRKKIGIVGLMLLLLLAACSAPSNYSDKGESAGEAGNQQQKKVVVAVQGENKFLEEAATAFEQQYTDIDIELQYYMAMPQVATGGGMTEAIAQADVEKYIQTVTTQIMAGKGSDLIVMNQLPQQKLVEKKMLVNLYDKMEQDSDFQLDHFYKSVLTASQDGDGLYAIPFAMQLDMVQGRQDLLDKAKLQIDDASWTWEQFKEVAKQLKQTVGEDYYAFINVFPMHLLINYMEENLSTLIDETGTAHFDSDHFREMMASIKSLYDEQVLQQQFSYDYDKALFSQTSLSSPEGALRTMSMANSVLFKSPTASGKGEGIPFRSELMMGMNSKSTVQEEAWLFLKFLLSDHMQQSLELSGIPINKVVAEQRIEEAATKLVNGEVEYADPVSAEVAEQQAVQLKELLTNVGDKLQLDHKVQSIAIEEFEMYMNNQKTAEEVSKLIQNRVSTYLNE